VNFVCEYYTASGAEVRGTLATIGGAKYGNQEAAFTKASTEIQGMQSERATHSSTSQTRADIAGGGFAASGSGLDILAQSASQGALQQAVIQRQGLIQEKSFEEQAQSYRNMESAADLAASAEKKAAGGAEWGAALKFGAGAADFVSKAWPALALLA
jgi:hypothetical protein